MFAISVQGVSKTYQNGGQALKNICLNVEKGQFLALLGKNGAGKTTFVEILSSLTKKTSGEILVMGRDLERDNEFVRACVGIVPQEFNLAIFESVIQVLVTQAGYFGIGRKSALKIAEKHLKSLDLWDKRGQTTVALSGGMKRRLMIARALMHDPQIIFFDEPTAGVDIEVRQKIWAILKNLNAEGKTIILTTHYFEEAEKLCDSLAIINKGEIIVNDSLSNIFHTYPEKKYLVELKQGIPLMDCNITPLSNTKFEVKIDKTTSLNKVIAYIIAQGGEIENIQPQSNRLEELFLNIVN
ncbi:ABC transporter ATP-binding protein [Candidatus Bandiella euplotis]|uniref:ABC transporter ATP-binding protein n=1 Tax=Candidatus Bandiella euplotis TaxID=1664265 RepID=A0ABZ0UQ17_9RICK|nr:ABC transporter ATP-binding protein [Candidatus Bandiella woodruffii]WPX96793.1 ABC transporter ATP-binding protein [Candidatus Bandiella woodruffii]